MQNHFRVKGENIGQPEVIFRKISFSVTDKHANLGENDFLKSFSTQNKRTLRRMENFLRRENSQASERRKRTSRGKIEKGLNPLKESRVSNATDMDISRKSVPII